VANSSTISTPWGSPGKLDGKMHELAVHLPNPEWTVRARKRYLASRPLGTP
jgi:hypothetical protein